MLDYPIGTRVAAAVIDGLVTALVTTLFWALPVMVFGLTLPVLAVTAAVLCVSVLPVSAFGASPGKAILGLEVRSADGSRPDAIALAFRELIGRGQLGLAYLSTLVAGLVGYASGTMSLALPMGLAALGVPLALLLASIGACSVLVGLAARDGRALHDHFGRTVVRTRAEPEPADADEDLEAFRRSAARGRVRRFAIGQVLVALIALGTPYLLARRPSAPALSLQDEVRIIDAKRNFERAPADARAFREYNALLVSHGMSKEIAEAAAQRDAVMAEQRRDPVGRDSLSRAYRAKLEASPCDQQAAVEAAERLNELEAYPATLALVGEVFGRCPPFGRLRWPAIVAHRELSQFDAAIVHDSALIEDDPLDHDYWAWRGDDRAKAGDAEGAHADYWVSISRAAYRDTASRLVELWHERSPCEAVRALRYHATVLEDEGLMEGAEALGELSSCLGTGRARISYGDRKTDAEVSGQGARLALAPEGITVITSTLARRAGLTLGAATTVLAGGELVPARLARARVALRGLAVDGARVAVVEDLPLPEVDGVIGLDWLSYFVSKKESAALLLTGRSAQ